MNWRELKQEQRDLAARMKDRMERLLALHRMGSENAIVFFAGLTLRVPREVFSPLYGEGTHLLGEQICGLSRDETVLDVGTGSGALACLAAIRGARGVVATDISPIAVECARRNVSRLGLHDKVEVREGDLFAPIAENERFSLIMFNAPFLEGKPTSWLERAMLDEGYRTVDLFVESLGSFLERDGRALLAWSSAGELDWLQGRFESSSLRWKIQAQLSGEFDFIVYELRRKVRGS